MTIAKGEVWLVSLEPTIGDEMRKSRPVVVVSNDAVGVLALRVIVPITAWQDRFIDWDWMVRLDPDPTNGLQKLSSADAFQVRSVSTRRFAQRLGKLSESDLARIWTSIKVVLEP
jgi:mRNA interferase MazF